MFLETGVEDRGRYGRMSQSCPHAIPCECGGTAQDVSGYIPIGKTTRAAPGMKLFAYNRSGKPNACGEMAIYDSGLSLLGIH